MKTRLPIIVLLLLGAAFAQDGQPVKDSLLNRARSGDYSAISKMERDTDLQGLQTLIRDPDFRGKPAVRLALAKLGDHDSLQFFACQSLTQVGGSHIFMSGVLDQIDGEFAIQAYKRLLDSDPRFLPAIEEANRKCHTDKKAVDCVVPGPPSLSALLELCKLVPDSPFSKLTELEIQAHSGEFKLKWKAWIDAHQSELQKFKPTAAGIRFDPASCSKFHDVSAVERRVHAIAGEHAVPCGPARYAVDTVPSPMNKCILEAFADKKPFYAWYEGSYALSTDRNDVAGGLASTGRGDVFTVWFDDEGASLEGWGANPQVFDDGDTIVVECPKPIKFREAAAGNLTCVSQAGNPRLSPH